MDKQTTFQINIIASANLGRCYNSATYEVLTKYPMRDESIKKMWEIGVLGCGQEFRLVEKSTKVPEGSLAKYIETQASVYRAVVEIRCDSGD